jgi:UPF0716 family protein affecting phage T7 exclusion
MTRRQRESRAFALMMATGGFSVVAVGAVLLAVIGVIGWGWAILFIVAAAVCGYLLRRMLAP